MLGRLVGAVDLEVEIADVTELRYPDPDRLEPARRALGARDDGRELGSVGGQSIDQVINRAARADAEHDAVFDVGQSGCGRDALLVFLSHGVLRSVSSRKRLPQKRECPRLGGHYTCFEPPRPAQALIT